MIYKLDKKWTIPCYILSDNLRAVTWCKNTERQKSNNFKYEKVSNVYMGDIVKHNQYGIGKVSSRTFDLDDGKAFQLEVDDKKINVNINDIEKQIQSFEYKEIEPIKRLFVISISGIKHEIYQFKNEKLMGKSVGDLNTVKEMVDIFVKDDGMGALLNLEAKWRAKPASDKQLFFAQKGLEKLGISLQDNNLNMGEVSVLIEQIKEYPTIECLRDGAIEDLFVIKDDLRHAEEDAYYDRAHEDYGEPPH